MTDGTVAFVHGRQYKEPESDAKAEPAVSARAFNRLVSNPSFQSVTGKLPRPERHGYVPQVVVTRDQPQVAAALPGSFSNRAVFLGKNEKYRELVSRFSRNAGFRSSFENELKEYFTEQQVDWLEGVWLEWDTRGSAPVIRISPGQPQMCDLGGNYVSLSADTKEQLDVLLACTCLFLEKLYCALDECKTPARTERLFKADDDSATGYAVSIDLRADVRKELRK